MAMLHFPRHPTALVLSASLAACAAGSSTTGTFGSGGSGAAGGNGGATSSSGTGAGNVGGGFTSSSSGSGGAAPVDFVAYAHSGKTLYEIDPNAPSATPKTIGDFDCIGGTPDKAMLDLAVSQSGAIWGISYANIHRLAIQGSVVHCATTIPLADASVTFYGLTFAPAGVIDPSKETLIAGNTAGELSTIDTTTGALAKHGTLGKVPANDGHGHTYPSDPATTGTKASQSTVGTAWQLSGDIVFLANQGNAVGFATVRDCTAAACSTVDTLIEIDMSKLKSVGAQSVTLSVRGQIVKKPGCGGAATAYQNMLGIAAWNDKVYGFSHKGAIVEIDNTDGNACLVVDTPTVFWNGAGVTTSAPVIVPN
jgi:hypothetical protein